MAPSSNGEDTTLSRWRYEFDSRWGYINIMQKVLDSYMLLFVYSYNMKKLIKEVREIKRKMSLPLVRKGPRGMIVRPKFTERETNLMIEMLTRRSKRHPIKGPGDIFAPMKMGKNE